MLALSLSRLRLGEKELVRLAKKEMRAYRVSANGEHSIFPIIGVKSFAVWILRPVDVFRLARDEFCP